MIGGGLAVVAPVPNAVAYLCPLLPLYIALIMGSIAAELRVSGQVFPVISATYGVQQATDSRGRASTKVRFGKVVLVLDVPESDLLTHWAFDPHKRLAADVVFRDAAGGGPLETVQLAGAYCVGYHEEFVHGAVGAGAFCCTLTLSDPDGFTWQPGGPAAPPQPAALVVAATLRAEQLASGLVKRVITPAGEVATEILGVGAAALLRTASLTAGLLLTPTNSKDDPGYKSEWDLYRRNSRRLTPLTKDQIRLINLEHLLAERGLTTAEEAEMIVLLAKVRGIYVQRLNQLTDKPRYAPIPVKWKEKGGRIDVLPNGNWRYTDWLGNVVLYEGDEPNFDPHALQQVDIEDMQGNCTTDFVKANAKAPLGPKQTGNTWHHKQNLKTMQEVPYGVHKRFTHYGARSIFKQRQTPAVPVPKKAVPSPKKPVFRKKKP